MKLRRRFLKLLMNEVGDENASVALLEHANIFYMMKGSVFPTQDRIISTVSYIKRIVKGPAVKIDTCLLFGMTIESIENIESNTMQLLAERAYRPAQHHCEDPPPKNGCVSYPP